MGSTPLAANCPPHFMSAFLVTIFWSSPCLRSSLKFACLARCGFVSVSGAYCRIYWMLAMFPLICGSKCVAYDQCDLVCCVLARVQLLLRLNLGYVFILLPLWNLLSCLSLHK